MKTFQQLQEGLYDPNIFKAFFMAGGPGSGKSYVVKKSTGGTGLKIVTSDEGQHLSCVLFIIYQICQNRLFNCCHSYIPLVCKHFVLCHIQDQTNTSL